MTPEELNKFLRENLTVKVETHTSYDYGDTEYLFTRVSLHLGDDEISYDEASVSLS